MSKMETLGQTPGGGKERSHLVVKGKRAQIENTDAKAMSWEHVGRVAGTTGASAYGSREQ